MISKIIMPEMGEGVVEGTIARWLVQEGDFVKQYDPILEIETDKVTTEATAEDAGTILQICQQEGSTVDVGTILAYIGEPGDEIPSNGDGNRKQSTANNQQSTINEEQLSTQHSAFSLPSPQFPSPSAPHPPASTPYLGRISPVVGRIAAEHEVDLGLVTGTGMNGRITKKDILAHIKNSQPSAVSHQPSASSRQHPALSTQHSTPPLPTSPAPQSPTLLPLTNIRRSIAEHMVRSKQTSPHVTTVFEFDFTAVSQHRATHKAQFARDGAKLTYTAYIVSATIAALKQHPMVNSSWAEGGIELKPEINVGMAAAIDEGLIVPVIKNADSLNLLGLARIINDLTQRARVGKLKPDEVQGGTFTITNHGTSGSLFATPIINQPQCGILGVGKIEKRVKVIADAIAIRPLSYVSLTFDHRILDGATADAFVSTLKEIIENWA